MFVIIKESSKPIRTESCKVHLQDGKILEINDDDITIVDGIVSTQLPYSVLEEA